MPLDVVIRHPNERIAVVELHGRMTHGTPMHSVEAQIRALALEKPGKVLILDLTHVEYADSAGLGLLVFLNGALKDAGGSLRIAGANNRLLEIFEITQTDTLLTLDPDLESSLSHAGAQISH
jgi:anti-sigma B factor antagonist